MKTPPKARDILIPVAPCADGPPICGDCKDNIDTALAQLKEALLEGMPKVVNDLETIKQMNSHLDSRLQETTLSESRGYIQAIDQATQAIEAFFEGR